MNITNNPYRYSQYNRMPQPAFKANPAVSVTEEAARQIGNKPSSFFKFFTDIYDNTSEFLSQNLAKHVLDNKYFNKFANSVKNSNHLFQHCFTTGSAITSGMYMQRTLTNKDMDKDRRNTLAVNQGLTFLVSTAGAYALDKYLNSWWENVTAKYAGFQLSDDSFAKDFKDLNASIKSINKDLKNKQNANLTEIVNAHKEGLSKDSSEILENIANKALKENDNKKVKSLKTMRVNDFINKLVKRERLVPQSETIAKRLNGMSLLKSMLVFGFVYRYFVPVAVTKPANILCEKYLARKKEKENKPA